MDAPEKNVEIATCNVADIHVITEDKRGDTIVENKVDDTISVPQTQPADEKPVPIDEIIVPAD